MYSIGNNSGQIGQTYSKFPKYLWILTLNERHVNLISLKICLINDDLTNPSSNLHLKEKKNSVRYSTFNNFVYLNRNFLLLENR